MKKISQLFVFTILMVVTVFLACKKDENEELIEIITSKAWRFGLTDLNTRTNPSGTVTYFAVPECEQDDTFTFKTDGTMVRTFGAKKCEGNTATSKTVNYSFNKETKELIIDGIKYSVAEENKSQFKYVLTVPEATGFSNRIYLLQ
ncbi:hypothetical protein D3C87_105540 [compost metagenome]